MSKASPKKGIVVAGHGSRHKEGLEVINLTAERYQRMHPEWEVRPAFMELAEPTFEMVIEGMMADGVKDITVVPMFLSFGHHMSKDLPKRADEMMQRFPGVKLHVTRHIGADPLLCEIIENRVHE